MEILAHRGYWKMPAEKNSLQALSGALERGFGIESDIRDRSGRLVIAHNMADENAIDLEEVLALFAGKPLCFAMNIKADGLAAELARLLEKHPVRYFAFDMSVPQMVEYRDAGLRFFTRQSEMEPEPVLYEDACGVWVDAFYDDRWIDKALLQKHLKSGKQVCIVSPELHGRAHTVFWERLRGWGGLPEVYLCTDLPEEAKIYFTEAANE